MKNKKIIVEIAFVEYTKKGEYDYTINSNFQEFENEKQARSFIKNNIKKNYEFYLYYSQEDVENNNHFDVIISNDIINK